MSAASAPRTTGSRCSTAGGTSGGHANADPGIATLHADVFRDARFRLDALVGRKSCLYGSVKTGLCCNRLTPLNANGSRWACASDVDLTYHHRASGNLNARHYEFLKHEVESKLQQKPNQYRDIELVAPQNGVVVLKCVAIIPGERDPTRPGVVVGRNERPHHSRERGQQHELLNKTATSAAGATTRAGAKHAVEVLLPMEITVNNNFAVMNSNLLQQYMTCPLARDLALRVKAWAKDRGLIRDAKNELLSSFAYTLMVVSFLQGRKLLPRLQDGEDECNWAWVHQDRWDWAGLSSEDPCRRQLEFLMAGWSCEWQRIMSVHNFATATTSAEWHVLLGPTTFDAEAHQRGGHDLQLEDLGVLPQEAAAAPSRRPPRVVLFLEYLELDFFRFLHDRVQRAKDGSEAPNILSITRSYVRDFSGLGGCALAVEDPYVEGDHLGTFRVLRCNNSPCFELVCKAVSDTKETLTTKFVDVLAQVISSCLKERELAQAEADTAADGGHGADADERRRSCVPPQKPLESKQRPEKNLLLHSPNCTFTRPITASLGVKGRTVVEESAGEPEPERCSRRDSRPVSHVSCAKRTWLAVERQARCAWTALIRWRSHLLQMMGSAMGDEAKEPCTAPPSSTAASSSVRSLSPASAGSTQSRAHHKGKGKMKTKVNVPPALLLAKKKPRSVGSVWLEALAWKRWVEARYCVGWKRSQLYSVSALGAALVLMALGWAYFHNGERGTTLNKAAQKRRSTKYSRSTFADPPAASCPLSPSELLRDLYETTTTTSSSKKKSTKPPDSTSSPSGTAGGNGKARSKAPKEKKKKKKKEKNKKSSSSSRKSRSGGMWRDREKGDKKRDEDNDEDEDAERETLLYINGERVADSDGYVDDMDAFGLGFETLQERLKIRREICDLGLGDDFGYTCS